MSSIYESVTLGKLVLKNRIVMAPMTRARNPDRNPDDLTAVYYAQRAGAGLIISEGLPFSPESCGGYAIPGIYTAEQVRRWRMVTDAVHDAGGVIFAQIWHVGRASHVQYQIGGAAPVSSVGVRAEATTYGLDADGIPGQIPQSRPRPLNAEEFPRLIQDFVIGARNAIEAGFDGVEIHGANGYLLEQFINGALNDRADSYGGSIAKRIRLPLEVVDAVVSEIGAERTGIRLAPFGRFNDMHPFADEAETWLTLATELSARMLAYVHLSDQKTLGAQAIPDGFVEQFRARYRGPLIVAGGLLQDNGQKLLDDGHADLIAIGRPFISNPDLVTRMKKGWPLNPADPAVYYGAIGSTGYTDFPPYHLAPTD